MAKIMAEAEAEAKADVDAKAETETNAETKIKTEYALSLLTRGGWATASQVGGG